MSDKVIRLSDYNRKNMKKECNFDECSEEEKIKMIKEKLYEELEQYYKETMNVVKNLENEYSIFKSTVKIIADKDVSKKIVYDYMLNLIDSFIENKNLLVCDDKKYKDIRNDLFKTIKEYYY